MVEVAQPKKVVGGLEIDESGFPVSVPLASDDKLEKLQRIVSSQYISSRDAREREREQHKKMGILDIVDAQSLSIPLDRYKKIKNDPRIIQALKDQVELEVSKNYTKENQELDHLSFNKPIPELVQERIDAHSATRKSILDTVKKVEKELEKRTKIPVKPRSQKAARDSDLSQFNPIEEDPVAKAREMESMKTQYAFFMKHRSNPSKITDVKITGLTPLKLYNMVISREGQNPEILEAVSVHRFGFTEHREMVPIIRAQPKSNLTQSWLAAVQAKMTVKKELEEKLGMSPTSPTAPVKRKATEEATDSRPSKK